MILPPTCFQQRLRGGIQHFSFSKHNIIWFTWEKKVLFWPRLPQKISLTAICHVHMVFGKQQTSSNALFVNAVFLPAALPCTPLPEGSQTVYKQTHSLPDFGVMEFKLFRHTFVTFFEHQPQQKKWYPQTSPLFLPWHSCRDVLWSSEKPFLK